jgi:hypothetical protein
MHSAEPREASAPVLGRVGYAPICQELPLYSEIVLCKEKRRVDCLQPNLYPVDLRSTLERLS